MVLTRNGTLTDTAAAGVSPVTEHRESESSKAPRGEKPTDTARAEITAGALGATDASGASTATEGTVKPTCQEWVKKRYVTRSDTGLPVRDPVRSKPRGTSHKSKSKKSNRHRELLAARAALLEKEVQLQAARVTLLELDESEEDEEVDSVSSEERHERTKNWIEEQDGQLEERSPVATGEGTKGIVRQPSAARRFDPQPQDREEGPSLTSQTHSRSEIKELAEAITAAARSAAPVTVPSVVPELPSFNGSSSEWLPFVAAYEEIAAKVTEAELLSRLRRCLKGAAKEAVHCLFVGKTTSAEVINLLRRRFGRPRALVKAEMDKLRALPKISENPRDVCIFASRVANITATVKALEKKQYLDHPEVVENVVDKLPSALRYRFYDFAAENIDEEPELVKLTNFLQQLADRVGAYAPAETVVEDRREKEGAKPSRRTTPAVRTYQTVTTSVPAAKKPEECCLICSEKDHQPTSCPTMKEADVDRRWELAREYRLCFRCLRPRKFRHQCKFKRCDVSGCTGTHHSMLHGSKLQVEQPPPPAKEEPDTAVVTSARETRTSALLKVLPVRVAGPSGACDTYALLDDGSTCTLIDAALAEKIGAEGPSQPFFIEGVAGARVDANTSRRVMFEISGRNSRPFTVSARTIDQLDLAAQTVTSETVRRLPHLQDLGQELACETGRPAVLVGQDNWHLLVAHEVRRGERDQPVASLTELGWVLHGIRDSPQRVHRILHIRVRDREEDEIERLMREHSSVTPRRSYNDEEQRAVQILAEETKSLPAGGEETEEAAAEERTHVAVAATRLREALPEITRFSNFQRVIRATPRVVQFIELLRKHQCCAVSFKPTAAGIDTLPSREKVRNKIAAAPRVTQSHVPLEARHIRRATELWLRSQQEETFALDIAALRRGAPLLSASRLTSLAIVMSNDGILRLKSRIARAADITACQSEPAIVDGDHPWTRLYIAWVHSQLHHAGFETTTTEVRQTYWVLRLRYAVRSVLKCCLVCRIQRATPTCPSTGNHHVGRLAHHQRPFTYTGIDYFGPLYVTVGRGKQKRYGALFTCLTTRAVHIEVAGSLSTDSAIMALRRFISRRGCPTELWSDQGTNLKGADQELKKAAAEALREEATIRGIEWRYIPPSAPFMGGAWECLVRSIKTALQVTLHERAPKEEVLTTLMAEAEHTVNSRPLTHVSTSPDDDEPLTPNHFLLGGPSRVPLPGTFTEGDAAGRKEWRKSQRLADMFWARWVKEYLPELQHRREPRPRGRAIRENDLVLIADGTLPRNQWPRGIVERTFPGPDGEVRAVDVRTSKGVLRRPTKKLVLLPGPDTDSE